MKTNKPAKALLEKFKQYDSRIKERGVTLSSSLIDKELSEGTSSQQTKSSQEFDQDIAALKQQLVELEAELKNLEPQKAEAGYFPSLFGSTRTPQAKEVERIPEQLIALNEILAQQAKRVVLLRVKEFKEKFAKFERAMKEQQQDLLVSTQQNITPSELLVARRAQLLEGRVELKEELNDLKQALTKELSAELNLLLKKSGSEAPSSERLFEEYSKKLAVSEVALEKQEPKLRLLQTNEQFLKVIEETNNTLTEARTNLISIRLQKFGDAIKEIGQLKAAEDEKDLIEPKRKVDNEGIRVAINKILMKHAILLEPEGRIDRKAAKDELFFHHRDRLVDLRHIEREGAEAELQPFINNVFHDVGRFIDTRKPNINFCSPQGESALHRIIREQNIYLLEYLLSKEGIAINYSSISDNDPYIKRQIDEKLYQFPGYTEEHVGMFTSEKQRLTDELLGDHPIDRAVKIGNSDVMLMLVLAGANIKRMISEEHDNGNTIGVNPRRSPLISIATPGFQQGRLYTIERLAQMQKKFGSNVTLPMGVEAGTAKSAKVWAATLIIQQMSPDDVMRDLKYLKNTCKEKELAFILPLATKYFSAEVLQKEGFQLDSPTQGSRKSSLEFFGSIFGSGSRHNSPKAKTPTFGAKRTPSTSPTNVGTGLILPAQMEGLILGGEQRPQSTTVDQRGLRASTLLQDGVPVNPNVTM